MPNGAEDIPSLRSSPLGFALLQNLGGIHNQREGSKGYVNLPACYAVNYRRNLGYDYASVVQTGGNR